MCDFGFLIDITQKLCQLNTSKLQSKDQLINNLFEQIKPFETILCLWHEAAQQNKTIHYPILHENDSENASIEFDLSKYATQSYHHYRINLKNALKNSDAMSRRTQCFRCPLKLMLIQTRKRFYYDFIYMQCVSALK